jgi:hypothetical protein
MEIHNFQASSAVQNGLVLCPLCHRGFDDHLNPVWIFYPTDLDFFINFELDDRRARLSNLRPRKVPDRATYLQHQKHTSAVAEDAELPLYVRRVLVPEDSLSARAIGGEKGWHGSPIAAIRNAWRCLGALRGNRIPREDRAKLSYLLDLYRTPLEEDVPPPPGLPPRAPPPSDDHNSEGDTTTGKGKGKAVEKRGTKRPPPVEATRASTRKRVSKGGRVEKGCQLKESTISSELIKKLHTQRTDIIHWLDEIEVPAPPTAPPTPE